MTFDISINQKEGLLILICRHIDDMQRSGHALVIMDMFIAAKFDLFVWEYCKHHLLLMVALPKSICVSLRVFNMGPMCRYASYMLFIMQTRHVFEMTK